MLVERVQSLLTDVGEQLQPRVVELASRVWAILGSPRMAWPVIATEDASFGDLVLRYVMPLAAIPPLAKLLGWSLLARYVRIGEGLTTAILSYALGLAGLALLALLAAKLAPLFEGEDDLGAAAKLVGYAATPSWIGGIFRVVPVLGILSLLASLYGCYLLYTGAPPVMGVPADRAAAYMGAVTVAAVLIFLMTSAILAALVGIDALGMV